MPYILRIGAAPAQSDQTDDRRRTVGAALHRRTLYKIANESETRREERARRPEILSGVAEDVALDPTRAIGAGARHEARPYRRHDRFILPRARARAAFQPNMEARPRYAKGFAKPCHRPDGTGLRNEAELHVDYLAK